MPISPQYVGGTHLPLNLQFKDDSGNVISLATGAPTLAAVFSGPTRFAGTGTFTITDAPNGKITYLYAASDLQTAGDWQIQITATFSDGTKVVADPLDIRIYAPL